MVPELINKYLWLIKTFVRYGNNGLTLSDLQYKWENKWNTEYPRKTFFNHRKAILEIFNIDIQCNRTKNTYFISSTDYISDTDKNIEWLLNSFTVNNLLQEASSQLKGRISVENIPSGHKHLTTIMDAMINNNLIRINYKKYTEIESEELNIKPYALKEFEKRWYLLGYCIERKALRVYGLDRIIDIEITNKVFTIDKDFNINDYFNNSFGIFLYDKKDIEEIYIATTDIDAKYLIDLPLHPSQTIIKKHNFKLDSKYSTVFKYTLAPNRAFLMELCKYGNKIYILSPNKLVEEIKNEIIKLNKLYNIC